MKFTDELTLRQFKTKANWKDSLGNFGVVECMGNHTIFKNDKTILKCIVKRLIKAMITLLSCLIETQKILMRYMSQENQLI